MLQMTTEQVESGLSSAYPIDKISADFYAYTEAAGMHRDGQVACPVGERVVVFPAGAPLEVMARLAEFGRYPAQLKTWVLVAVGGVVKEEGDLMPTARYFFAKLRYKHGIGLSRIDFSRFY